MTLDFWSFSFYFPSAGITGRHHHAQFYAVLLTRVSVTECFRKAKTPLHPRELLETFGQRWHRPKTPSVDWRGGSPTQGVFSNTQGALRAASFESTSIVNLNSLIHSHNWGGRRGASGAGCACVAFVKPGFHPLVEQFCGPNNQKAEAGKGIQSSRSSSAI